MLPIATATWRRAPGIHIYGIAQGAIAGEQAVTELVTGRAGAWTDEPSRRRPPRPSRTGARKGYLTEGANGISRDDALADFGKGRAAFVITGTWEQPKADKRPRRATPDSSRWSRTARHAR